MKCFYVAIHAGLVIRISRDVYVSVLCSYGANVDGNRYNETSLNKKEHTEKFRTRERLNPSREYPEVS